MGNDKREKYEKERARLNQIDDDDTRHALTAFADALDRTLEHVRVPTYRKGSLAYETKSDSTAAGYLKHMRTAHLRGLDLLGADAATVNAFMSDLVTEPDRRRTDLVGDPTPRGKDTLKKSTVGNWQSAAIAFYRFCNDPTASDDRPDTAMSWDAVDDTREIRIFSKDDDAEDGDERNPPEQADLDAMREACLQGQNTRRDRAFVDLAAGTGQRVYALVTLRVKHVTLDADRPHIKLNPEIENNGDKGAIGNAGRWKPIVTDTGAIREWVRNHPLRDDDVRAEHGAPDDFDDCYLFVGDLGQRHTDAASHWKAKSARNMLTRRKADTAGLSGVTTVEADVNPHAWRHYAYTRSLSVNDVNEPKRRKVFGWAAGSDTGQSIYGHMGGEQAGKDYFDAHMDQLGTDDAAAVAEQVVGDAVKGDLSPEALETIARGLAANPDSMAVLADALAEARAD